MSWIDLDRNLAFVHVAKTSGAIWTHWLWNECHLLRCAAHDSAEYIRDRFPQYWNPAFKVAFVRNPWAWWVSAYYWFDFKHQYPTFDAMMLDHERWFMRNFPFEGQWRTICDGKQNLLVDFVGRTERLQEDFDLICDKISYTRFTLPKRETRRIYSHFYTPTTREIVAKISRIDIEKFGFTYQDGVA